MTQHSKPNDKKERIGVYVCHCGSYIAGTVDVENVSHWAGEELKDRGVVVSRDYKFMCSSLGQELIEQDIKEQGLLATPARENIPHRHRTRWFESIPVRVMFDPRAGFLGAYR